MKVFASWLVITLSAFAALSGGYHLVLSGDPHRVLVVVDSSFEMKRDWGAMPRALDRIDNRRYSQFALATEKGPVHGFGSRLEPDRLTPYAPRKLNGLDAIAELSQFDGAAERILVTNAPASEVSVLSGWTIVRP